MIKKDKIIFISTFPPEECGIATYTESLIDSMKRSQSNIAFEVIAVGKKGLNYPNIVKSTIEKENNQSYLSAAEAINNSDAKVVSLQHEFWIYGGFNGQKIIGLLKNLKKPVVLTLHSVPIFTEKPFNVVPDRYKSRTKLLREVFQYVSAVIVMTDSAKKYICEKFGLKEDTVFVLPHGAPALPKEKLLNYRKEKDSIGLRKNDFVLTSFGLISPKKGLEYVIKALPEIILKNQSLNIKYLITGQMRPNKPKKYLLYLKNLTKQLKLEGHVTFDSRYLTVDEIFRYLANTNVYITPYYKKEQTSSGTLSYALAAGCCIVSTPYFFAYDLIKKNRLGELIEFRDHQSVEKVINNLIKDKSKISSYQKESYQVGQSIEFSKVAKYFINICGAVCKEQK